MTDQMTPEEGQCAASPEPVQAAPAQDHAHNPAHHAHSVHNEHAHNNYGTPPPPHHQYAGQYAAPQYGYAPQPPRKGNGMGTAGFVLALIGLFFGWVPVLGWIIWLLGLIFSFVGVFRKPAGLAIAGLVISAVGLIVAVMFYSALVASLDYFDFMDLLGI